MFKLGRPLRHRLLDTSYEGFVQAFNDYLDKKLVPFYISQKIPLTNDNPVKVIVGDSFEQMVYNDNYVLVEVYSPECYHCKELEPIYLELAKRLENEIDITIAKFDGTRNEHADVTAPSYPKIFLYLPDNKEPVEFQLERTLKNLVRFMEENTRRLFEGIQSSEL